MTPRSYPQHDRLLVVSGLVAAIDVDAFRAEAGDMRRTDVGACLRAMGVTSGTMSSLLGWLREEMQFFAGDYGYLGDAAQQLNDIGRVLTLAGDALDRGVLTSPGAAPPPPAGSSPLSDRPDVELGGDPSG